MELQNALNVDSKSVRQVSLPNVLHAYRFGFSERDVVPVKTSFVPSVVRTPRPPIPAWSHLPPLVEKCKWCPRIICFKDRRVCSSGHRGVTCDGCMKGCFQCPMSESFCPECLEEHEDYDCTRGVPAYGSTRQITKVETDLFA